MMTALALDPAAPRRPCPAPKRGGGPGGGGERREPEILLLDEPTNHLDLIAIEWLENHTRWTSRSAIALVSHDKRLRRGSTGGGGGGGGGGTGSPRSWFRRLRGLGGGGGGGGGIESADKLDRRIVSESIGCAMASPRGGSAICAASATREGSAGTARCAPFGRAREYGRAGRQSLGALVVEAERISGIL